MKEELKVIETKNMSKNIVIDIPFNIDLSPYMLPKNYIHPKLEQSYKRAQNREWIERRIELFMKYTCKSLVHQTNQDFLCLLRCTQQTEEIISNILERYPKLPQHIQFTSKAQQLIDNTMMQYGNLYRVVIDSDNMFHETFIEKLHQFNHYPQTLTIISQEGYILDDATKRLTHIFHQSPSFYAAIYNPTTYELLYQKRLFEKHWDAIKYPYEQMTGANYCICVHDLNVDNEFDKMSQRYGIRQVEGAEKQAFFKEWHL